MEYNNKRFKKPELREMSLDEIHTHCMGILHELDNFCNQLGINYFLIAGSALGAVRNQGIIPWDDDIDVGMMRADFELFVKEYPDTAPFKLFAQGKSEGFVTPFAKLCDSNTIYVEPDSRSKYQGVFVDIFPLDYIKYNPRSIALLKWRKRLYDHSFVYDYSAPRFQAEHFVKRSIRKLFSLSYRFRNPVVTARRITSSVASAQPTDKIMNIWGTYNEREVMNAEWLGDGSICKFEDLQCRVPAMWDDYLTAMYDDYMVPPNSPPKVHGHGFFRVEEEPCL